ncbi:MAG: DUF2288 domain-containing protein [Gammaproteobacteria bacterium]|nr:DUF2288 domain-containing protein [Gammaproteobacteria bacterium]
MKTNDEEKQLESVEKGKINLETAKINWQDLERFFAAGSIVYVVPQLALIDVAYALSQDDTTQFKAWMDENLVAHVSDQQAIAWHKSEATVWSVVVKPWILVQDT